MQELILAIICFGGFVCGVILSKILKDEILYGKNNYGILKFYIKYNLTRIYPFVGLLFLLELNKYIISAIFLFSIIAGSLIKLSNKNELLYYLLFFVGPILRTL